MMLTFATPEELRDAIGDMEARRGRAEARGDGRAAADYRREAELLRSALHRAEEAAWAATN